MSRQSFALGHLDRKRVDRKANGQGFTLQGRHDRRKGPFRHSTRCVETFRILMDTSVHMGS